MSGTFTSSAIIEPATELLTFVNHLCIATFDIGGVPAGAQEYSVSAGSTLPLGLSLGTASGIISGIVLEMDGFVDEFNNKPEGFKYDEENYATFGSAKTGSKTFTFSIDAFHSGIGGGTSTQLHSILIRNNWSSDRDEFIREIDNQFFIDGVKSTNEEYLTEMKSRGYFPAS